MYLPITLKSRDKRKEKTKCTVVPQDFIFLMEEATESPWWHSKTNTQKVILGNLLHFCHHTGQAKGESVHVCVCDCVFPTM